MDQLKAMLPAIKQHSFWGMCIGILVVSAVSWWMSTGALSKQKAERESQIKSSFGGVEQIRQQQPKHPNESTSKGMQALLERFSQEVAEGWKVQYDHQATVLVWPASFDQEFHDAVNKLRPIEAIPVTSAGQIEIQHDLPIDLRQQYRNYIEEDLPVLATTIGTKWMATSSGLSDGGGEGMAGGAGIAGVAGTPPGYAGDAGSTPAADTSIVLWPSSSQQEIMNTHFAFTGSSELPTTLEVLYAQEDLWVLQSIMDIIKSTNGDAETRHDAIIKELHFVRVGRSALGLAGAISAVGQNAQGGATGGMPPLGMPDGSGAPSMVGPPGSGAGGMPPGAGGMPPGAGGGASPMPGMPGGEGGAGAMTDLADGRYVDEQYQPLKAARLRGSLKSRDPQDALLAVAKRMPVRVRFKLNQQRLHRVLAEFGNSRLPVEIRQVRINRPAASGSSEGFGDMGAMAGGGGTPAGGGGGPPGVFGGGNEGMGGVFGGGARGAGSSIADASIDPNLIDVELYGVVYIYNPVNKSQLGLPEPPVTAMTPPPAPAVPTTPTTTPATATPPATSGAAIPAAAIPAVVGS